MRGGKREGAGRKPGSLNESTIEIREIARKYGPEMIEGLVQLARSAESESARTQAMGMVLDRGYGKPKQELEHVGKDGGPIQTEELSASEAARRIAFTLAQATATKPE